MIESSQAGGGLPADLLKPVLDAAGGRDLQKIIDATNIASRAVVELLSKS